MEKNTFKRGPSLAKKHFRDFLGMALQIMAFNLASGGRDHGSSSVLNSIGFVLLRILMERNSEKKEKEQKASTFYSNTRNIVQKPKSKSYGNRQPKV